MYKKQSKSQRFEFVSNNVTITLPNGNQQLRSIINQSTVRNQYTSVFETSCDNLFTKQKSAGTQSLEDGEIPNQNNFSRAKNNFAKFSKFPQAISKISKDKGIQTENMTKSHITNHLPLVYNEIHSFNHVKMQEKREKYISSKVLQQYFGQIVFEMEFDNSPKYLKKRQQKHLVNPFDNNEKKSEFKIALNQQIYNNLHKSIKHFDLHRVENIENYIEYEMAKFDHLGKDFYNEQERAQINDKQDLKNYIIKRSKVFFEMRDFNLSTSINNPNVDVLNFKVFSRNSFLKQIIKIVKEFVNMNYPEVETSDQIYYYKLSKPVNLNSQPESSKFEKYESKQVSKKLNNRPPYKYAKKHMQHIEDFYYQKNKEFQENYRQESETKPAFKTGFTENNDMSNLRKFIKKHQDQQISILKKTMLSKEENIKEYEKESNNAKQVTSSKKYNEQNYCTKRQYRRSSFENDQFSEDDSLDRRPRKRQRRSQSRDSISRSYHDDRFRSQNYRREEHESRSRSRSQISRDRYKRFKRSPERSTRRYSTEYQRRKLSDHERRKYSNHRSVTRYETESEENKDNFSRIDSNSEKRFENLNNSTTLNSPILQSKISSQCSTSLSQIQSPQIQVMNPSTSMINSNSLFQFTQQNILNPCHNYQKVFQSAVQTQQLNRNVLESQMSIDEKLTAVKSLSSINQINALNQQPFIDLVSPIKMNPTPVFTQINPLNISQTTSSLSKESDESNFSLLSPDIQRYMSKLDCKKQTPACPTQLVELKTQPQKPVDVLKQVEPNLDLIKEKYGYSTCQKNYNDSINEAYKQQELKKKREQAESCALMQNITMQQQAHMKNSYTQKSMYSDNLMSLRPPQKPQNQQWMSNQQYSKSETSMWKPKYTRHFSDWDFIKFMKY